MGSAPARKQDPFPLALPGPLSPKFSQGPPHGLPTLLKLMKVNIPFLPHTTTG